jgi:hypothetical protein
MRHFTIQLLPYFSKKRRKNATFPLDLMSRMCDNIYR